MIDNSLNMIKHDTDKVEVGLKQTVKAIEEKKAQKVFLADDCEDRIRIPIKELCSENGVELVRVPTMRILGKACGIDVKASCAAVLRN